MSGGVNTPSALSRMAGLTHRLFEQRLRYQPCRTDRRFARFPNCTLLLMAMIESALQAEAGMHIGRSDHKSRLSDVFVVRKEAVRQFPRRTASPSPATTLQPEPSRELNNNSLAYQALYRSSSPVYSRPLSKAITASRSLRTCSSICSWLAALPCI